MDTQTSGRCKRSHCTAASVRLHLSLKQISSGFKETDKSIWQQDSNINLEKWETKPFKGHLAKKAKHSSPKTEGINILHQAHLRKAHRQTNLKSCLLFQCWAFAITQVMTSFRHSTLLKTIMLLLHPPNTSPQILNLPVHLRAEPFFVFCSFKLPFILSLPFIFSCVAPLLPTSYQFTSVPGWEASTGWRRGEKWGVGGGRWGVWWWWGGGKIYRSVFFFSEKCASHTFISFSSFVFFSSE